MKIATNSQFVWKNNKRIGDIERKGSALFLNIILQLLYLSISFYVDYLELKFKILKCGMIDLEYMEVLRNSVLNEVLSHF